MGIHTSAATKAHTSTLRLAGYLTTILSTSHTPEAADLARTVSADPAGITLDTLARVSGLFRVSPEYLYREGTA